MKRISAQYADGLITAGERYNKVIDIWANVSEQIANVMMEKISTEIMTDERDGYRLRYGGYRIGKYHVWGATAGILGRLGVWLGEQARDDKT